VVTDNCPGTTYVCSPASGSSFLKGTNSVNCTATDASGNIGSCTFTVTVEDHELPTILCPANIVVSTSGSGCVSNVTFTALPADNCSGVTSACVPASGNAF